MLKKNKKTLILTCIIIVLPIIVGVVLWDKLPETMATHFGINNDANGFSSKLFAVVGLPIILLLIQFICAVVTAKDPRKQNISNKLYVLVLWIVPCISIFVSTFVYAYNLGVKINISLFASMFIGLLFIIMGNYLPKMRQNYSMGIKLPWTLANEENWNKTHRLAGTVYIVVGISIILTTLIAGLNNIWIILIAVFVAFAIPSIYSFMLHVRKGL
ncbi:MAG: SdpI family protein [Eubacteriales bacterium]|nr:SdpI family protein [Eubacteriales bacterium]MDY3332881.1 SdpI family protein [Gallibacter sp.]